MSCVKVRGGGETPKYGCIRGSLVLRNSNWLRVHGYPEKHSIQVAYEYVKNFRGCVVDWQFSHNRSTIAFIVHVYQSASAGISSE
jgi:hypothetical protein